MKPKPSLPKDVDKMLKSHGVTPEQYVGWAMNEFQRLTYLAGKWISLFVALLFIGIAIYTYQTDPTDMQTVWGMIASGVFVTLIFVASTYMTKNNSMMKVGRFNTPGAYRALDAIRRTDIKFLNKLTEAQWQSIQKFNVQAHEAEMKRKAPKPVVSQQKLDQIVELKNKFKKIGWVSSLILIFLVVNSFFWAGSTYEDSFYWGVGITYVLAVAGLDSWIFLYGYHGLSKREIYVKGEIDDAIYTGGAAVAWSIFIMLLSVMFFVGFMLIPIGLLLQWT
jgi:hypothetical protein